MSTSPHSSSAKARQVLQRAGALARYARKRALEVSLNIHPGKAIQAVHRLRRQFPDATRDELARRIVQRRMWKSAAIGFVTGAPSSPWTAPWLAALDVTLGLRHHVETACQVAALYDPAFFENEGARWELLVPVLDAVQEGKALDAMAATQGRQGVTESVRQALRGDVLGQIRRLTVRRLGILLVKKAVLAKAIPVVGSAVGGLWGLAEAWTIGDRIVEYFADKPSEASPTALLSDRTQS
jgi:hypothetical protein